MRAPPQITVREIRRSDFADLVRFFEENNRPEVTQHFHPFPLIAETAHQIAHGDRRDRYYVATEEGRIRAMCMLRGWDEGYEVPSYGVLVDHRYRGHGLGRRMTEFSIAEARRCGAPSLRLSVYASNTGALALYASLDFAETGRQEVVVDGESDRKIIMVKDLR